MLNLLPLVFFFGGLTLCLTGLKRGRGLAVGVSSAFAGVTYFINNLGSTVDMPEWLDYISPWYYYGGDSVLANGINWQNFLLLAGLSVLLYAVGVWGFSQRELAA